MKAKGIKLGRPHSINTPWLMERRETIWNEYASGLSLNKIRQKYKIGSRTVNRIIELGREKGVLKYVSKK